MLETDLAIVGGGFAGLACAEAASARGLSTIVLEAKPRIGAQPHTTGLLVKELADELDVPRRLTRKIHGVRLYAPNLRYIDLHRPGYYFLATDTPGVLRWMARRAAENGAHIRCAKRAERIERISRGVTIDGDIRSRFIVGADGANSPLAAALGLSMNTRFLSGVEVEMEGIGGVQPDMLHVFLDRHIARGYIAWVIPGLHFTQIGIAASKPHRPDLNGFLTKISGLFDLSCAKRVGTRAGLIPVGGRLRRIGDSRSLLIGDAAGMVSPLTAGGIHTAVHCGRAAGVSISDYVLDGGETPYRSIQRQSSSFLVKHVVRCAWDIGAPNWMLNSAIGSSTMRLAAQLAFYHHRGLFDVREWPSVMRSVILRA